MTVVTIILIAAIVAIATPIVSGMMKQTDEKAKCMNEGKCWNAETKQCNVCGQI